MSNVPTAAEIVSKIFACKSAWGCEGYAQNTQDAVNILEEWVKQLQPKPDESDIEVARKCSCDFVERNAQFIAKHIEAKCAEAWRLGAEVMWEKCTSQIYDCIECMPIPEYQGKK